MDELDRWTDNGPLVRHFQVTYTGDAPAHYNVTVWDAAGRSGDGMGHSLNFAAVKALIAYDASEAAP